MKSEKIAVLVPCYNEEKTIKKVVEDFRKVLPEAVIYVYDNNSSDKSYEIVEKMAKKGVLTKKVVLRKEPRQGKGNVVRQMFREIQADCYIMVDADDTYPAESAREMSELVLSGQADMVVGDRLSTTYFSENKRPMHNFGNKIVRWLIRRLFQNDIHDIMTGYRAFSREFVKGFPVLSKGFEIETEMSIHAVDKNYRIVEIPIEYRDRPEGSESKLSTYTDGLKVLKTIGVLFAEYKPLRFFTILAVIFGIIGLVLVWPAFSEYFQAGFVTKIPRLVVGCFLILFGLLDFVTGLILQVINKKDRQRYEILMNLTKNDF
ncbi:MAG: glycosyltransferase family 2 protein [Candidatus Saccharibacteria bacterium]|nr:glycosyltransferase family 2 protein [Candidatus Saccharibacteria bacterium]